MACHDSKTSHTINYGAGLNLIFLAQCPKRLSCYTLLEIKNEKKMHMPLAIFLSKVPGASQVYRFSEQLTDSCMLHGAAKWNRVSQRLSIATWQACPLLVRQVLYLRIISCVDSELISGASFFLKLLGANARGVSSAFKHRDSKSLSGSCLSTCLCSVFRISDNFGGCGGRSNRAIVFSSLHLCWLKLGYDRVSCGDAKLPGSEYILGYDRSNRVWFTLINKIVWSNNFTGFMYTREIWTFNLKRQVFQKAE